MDLQQISNLTHESVSRLTSDEYKDAFNSPETGKAFAEKINALDSQPRQATRKAGNVRGEQAPEPQSSGFDPSFDGDEEQPAPVAAPAAVQPAASVPAEPMSREKMSVWSYFATDEAGRKIGGEQKFFYDPNLPAEDPNSLASQLTKSNIHVRRMANKRKVEGIIESVKTIGEYMPPTLLTVDQHPNAEQLNAMTMNAHDNAVRSALNLFRQSHPEFPLGNDNAVAMMSWIAKSGRSPLEEQTWELAWKSLKPYLVIETPAAEVVAPAPAPVAPAPKAAPAVRPSQRAGISTGLSSADETSLENPAFEQPIKVVGVKLVMPDGKTQVMTFAAYDRLSTDVQKRILRNGFRNGSNQAAIEALYNAENERRAAARSGR